MMSKPRLAEILGVEVDEVFTLRGEEGKKCAVDGCGIFYVNGACESGDIYDLMYIINNPEVIVRKPKLRWTKQDIEDARTMKKYFSHFDIVRRTMIEESFGKELKESLCLIKGCQGIKIDNLKSFPSLPIGKSAKLDDIINSEPVE